jgi:uncharacterized membrane protein YidH (DUF202 family)
MHISQQNIFFFKKMSSDDAYSNNPATLYSALLSGQRTMITTTSVAIAVIGFSKIFDGPVVQFVVKLMGICIFVVALWAGIQSSRDFDHYLKYHEGKLPAYYPVNNWKLWSALSYVYGVFIVCILGLFLAMKMKIPFVMPR